MAAWLQTGKCYLQPTPFWGNAIDNKNSVEEKKI